MSNKNKHAKTTNTARLQTQKNPLKRLAKVLAATLLALLILVAAAQATVLLSGQRRFSSPAAVQSAPYAIVLGTSAANGEAGQALSSRLDLAVALYQADKVEKILCSGDHLSRYYDEPGAMRDYLLEAGIPDEAIVLDPMGLRTYDTMWRAQKLYGIDKAILCTQRYHAYRAVFLAENLGISVQACPTDNPSAGLSLQVREFGARFLALWEAWIEKPEPLVKERVPLAFDERSPELQALGENDPAASAGTN